jgi:hypothetical protein
MGGVNLGRLLDGLAAAHGGGFERTGRDMSLERFRAKWIPVRVKKRVKIEKQGPVLIPSEPKGSL